MGLIRLAGMMLPGNCVRPVPVRGFPVRGSNISRPVAEKLPGALLGIVVAVKIK
jgi:hypothetical protein